MPTGLTLYLDIIAKASPFVYDTLIGFNHTIEARNQAVGTTNYSFSGWSDGGAQLHTIVVPAIGQTYQATYTTIAAPIAFVQVNCAAPQTPQQTVQTTFTQAQAAGNANVVVIGWNDTTSTITSVSDSAGNAYRVAAPLARANGLSQAIYYASNIATASNTVTVTFNQPAATVDLRIVEYRGLDPTNPLDVTAASSGVGAGTATSGPVTTTAAKVVLVGAGMTLVEFTAPGPGFTTRVITQPDADIVEDQVVSSTGTYTATAPVTGSWLMQVAAFKGAGQ